MTASEHKAPNLSKTGRKVTPMLAQYLEIKAQHPGALLLFRMGDFYETFFEDAQTLAQVAGVALTSRDAKSDHPIPLAGVPYHAIDTYLTRLLGAGLTVAICDQVEDPALAKGLVKREVVEIISPGTATAPELMDSVGGHFCLAWLSGQNQRNGAWALVDASTGSFRCGLEATTLPSLCQRHRVREVIVSENDPPDQISAWQTSLPETVINQVNSAWFHPALARQTLLEHFQLASLSAFGLEDPEREPAVSVAGALLRYLKSLAMRRPDQVTSLQFSPLTDRLVLDEETLRNLEIFQCFRGEKGPGTLVHHLDGTKTPMGHRLLELRLAEPLLDLKALERWHLGVEAALQARQLRADLRATMTFIGDLERLAARTASGRSGPSGLRQLGTGLQACQKLAQTFAAGGEGFEPMASWLASLPDLNEVSTRILATIAPEAGASTRKRGFIAPDVNQELDHCRDLAKDSKGFLTRLQAQERDVTGISTLKVGYNRVFGYYLEVTNKHLEKVPEHYEQKQTLVGSCRYHTPELKEAENAILAAEQRADELELEIFQDLLKTVALRLPDLRESAQLVAQVDLMLGFAEIAERYRYCRPNCDDSLEYNIKDGRHPVVEQLVESTFIPNDTTLDNSSHQILLLTGPNMGGKSTYLRQVALIALMAQAGSFVPARSARIGVVDRIFTRVGASDNLARGESTFYMEMSETAHILHQMTSRSLVILDEVGRGTSTYDGLSLAWAMTEFLGSGQGPRPRTIFATHYHELTELETTLPGLENLQLEVKEWEGKIIFLHTVRPGRSDKSYGIHVARLAGLPAPLLRRAEDILAQLATGDQRDLPLRQATMHDFGIAAETKANWRIGSSEAQLSLFSEAQRDALSALRSLDLEKISPLDAFAWLLKIKQQLDQN